MARGGKREREREREREKVDCPGILRDVPELCDAVLKFFTSCTLERLGEFLIFR